MYFFATSIERFFEQDISLAGQTFSRPHFPLHLAPSTYSAKPPTNLELHDATFCWSDDSFSDGGQTTDPAFAVSNLSATFATGLNLICGPIASGKTLLLLGRSPLYSIHLTSYSDTSPRAARGSAPCGRARRSPNVTGWDLTSATGRLRPQRSRVACSCVRLR